MDRGAEETHLYALKAHLARRGVWGAWHWAWGAENPSSRHWHCQSLQVGSSCQKQPIKNKPSWNRSLVQMQSWRRIPVCSRKIQTTVDHVLKLQLIYVYQRFKTTSTSYDTWAVPVSLEARCFPTGEQATVETSSGWLTTVLILLEQNYTCYLPSPASWVYLLCVLVSRPPLGHMLTQKI